MFKIDKLFVINILNNRVDRTIVKALIEMAQKLGKIIIAEGVETKEQLTFLQAIGCGEIQVMF
jgi:EAL domain-containing protein (putative c-di-GMP-specific phosphodiesterase class I)